MYTGTYECRGNRTCKERKPESCVKMFSGSWKVHGRVRLNSRGYIVK